MERSVHLLSSASRCEMWLGLSKINLVPCCAGGERTLLPNADLLMGKHSPNSSDSHTSALRLTRHEPVPTARPKKLSF